MSSDQLKAGKRALGDVLWEAANLYLAADDLASEPPYEFSCAAVTCALTNGETVFQDLKSVSVSVAAFLRRLGCDPSSWDCFRDADKGQDRQGVRYMWLLLAMHVADDEGVLA